MKSDDAKALINVLYNVILDRKPDKTGAQYWYKKLIKDEINDIQMASQLFDSNEYQNKKRGEKE